MHEHPSTAHEHQPERADTAAEYEQPPRPRPAIYVASLADYNEGRLHGEWIDAARDPADIHADIAAMLARSRTPGAEEFAIHDYEQFGVCRIHEYDGIELVARIARGIAEHGYAYAAWAEVHESEPERLDDFEAAFLGHYESVEAYTEQLADDFGYHAELATLPEALLPYVHLDYAAMARDLEAGGDVYVHPDPAGGVWLFDGHV